MRRLVWLLGPLLPEPESLRLADGAAAPAAFIAAPERGCSFCVKSPSAAACDSVSRVLRRTGAGAGAALADGEEVVGFVGRGQPEAGGAAASVAAGAEVENKPRRGALAGGSTVGF